MFVVKVDVWLGKSDISCVCVDGSGKGRNKHFHAQELIVAM
jgi:hypothetical protein